MKTNDQRASGLDPFKAEFKQAVLQHIRHGLKESGWARLRQFATDRRRSRFCDINIPKDISPDELIDLALEGVGLSVNEVMTPDFKDNAKMIATIQGQPVYFILGMGIYFWGERPRSRPTLHFWGTFPVYPPGW
jgi:hypothetical protein